MTEAVMTQAIDAALAGDAMAFARIVRTHHDDMARVCQVVCGDPDLAQEAAQAAWPIAWQRLGTLRDPAKLRPWLISIAVNEGRRLLRRDRRIPVVEINAAATISTATADPADRVSELDLIHAVRRLPPEDRVLLAMRYVAGFDATEIGVATGMSASGVRSRLSRLVARLREEVSDD